MVTLSNRISFFHGTLHHTYYKEVGKHNRRSLLCLDEHVCICLYVHGVCTSLFAWCVCVFVRIWLTLETKCKQCNVHNSTDKLNGSR